MCQRAALLLALTAGLAAGVIVDRIAIVVGNSIVKNSDIERDMRATEFLNDRPLDLGKVARKASADRLIDQIFIRREIELGDYPTATMAEADRELAALRKQRFRSESMYLAALKRYGLPPVELRTQFQWQLSVLRFIETRFKPAVLVTDDDVAKYRRDHAAALSREYPGESQEGVADKIRDILTAEKVNQQFFAWLDDQRKNSKIEYREDGLR